MCAFGSHRLNMAPVGSWITDMRPWSITSNGGASILPPRLSAFLAAASISVTLTYMFQCGGMCIARSLRMLSGGGTHVPTAHREDRVDPVRSHVVFDDVPAEQPAIERD